MIECHYHTQEMSGRSPETKPSHADVAEEKLETKWGNMHATQSDPSSLSTIEPPDPEPTGKGRHQPPPPT